ncbi:heterokaryon incompatibility protein 6, OR allele [Podospora australis]|uniref:Heterokaryon incompatibility protein 6, OR allele n=1 Tax=Podospora australis TaxID=1536484 RepID=A0AAN6WQ56_9PEZI|nr:heterokaryon incompatibility protein 6, OR allele [Podospora australis]
MRHTIRKIETQNIRDHETQVTIDMVWRSRDTGDDTGGIEDPDVRAMLKDFGELKATRGKSGLDAADSGKNVFSIDGFSDEQLENVMVRKQMKSEAENDNGASSFTLEDEEKFKQYRHHCYVRRWGLLTEKPGLDEEWFIPNPPVLPEDDPEYLCEMCRHIDFEVLFTRQGIVGNVMPGPTDIHLQGLDRVLQNETCSFCTLLRRKIANDNLLPDPTKVLPGSPIHLRVIHDAPDFAAKIEVEIDSYERGTPKNRFVLQRFDSTGTDPTPLQGRPVSQENADLDLLKQWYRTCKEVHGAKDEGIGSGHALGDGINTLKVIDTTENRICDIETSDEYACLSYVWGTAGNQTQYTEATKEVLETPGGLLKEFMHLPQTIKDTMGVIRHVGLRYLWVDALCIRQDDEHDKARLISRMHEIYGNAALTVVAAANSNPFRGLAGVGSVARTRTQIIQRFQGITVAAAFHDARKPYADIEKSVWNSRAWTFQERVLSQRIACFTDSQMTFNCPHVATMFEDTVPVTEVGYAPRPVNDELQIRSRMVDLFFRLFHDPTEAEHPNKAFISDYTTTVYYAEDKNGEDDVSPEPAPVYVFAEAPAPVVMGLGNVKTQTLWDLYRRAVNDYTKRKLTCDIDAVNAFSGIEGLIRRGANTTFWHGIPEFEFDRALLWVPQEPLRRRKQDGMPLFPSWAWCAWDGHSSYRGRGYYNSLRRPSVSVVKWLQEMDKQEWIARVRALEGEPPEEVEARVQHILDTRLLLRPQDPNRLWHPDFEDLGWKSACHVDRNEHMYYHEAYPGLRFSYPISLPDQKICTRPLGSNFDTLAFVARTAPVRFVDIIAEGHVQEPLQHRYIQLGINDADRSANFRPDWKRIIYHQGYRAGFLSLNIPFADIDVSSHDKYFLVAMSMDELPRIAPPTEGWDRYWGMEPPLIQRYWYQQEWPEGPRELVLPDPDVKPDTGCRNENGDPYWDEDRFGHALGFRIYNVLLLEEYEDDEGLSRYQRIGVGKMQRMAFNHAKPVVETIVLK